MAFPLIYRCPAPNDPWKTKACHNQDRNPEVWFPSSPNITHGGYEKATLFHSSSMQGPLRPKGPLSTADVLAELNVSADP
ncbi:hypothetical protein CDAR_454731 [Caerostris darwini]|uniref:Uncharacterized protein n=1 Tax=Caerostris darwini TaxID=1538125 RepID=A0AAV4TVP9_9ARAC|nr:hypothetical protein CDAR_454731 [Caerostris darwini]